MVEVAVSLLVDSLKMDVIQGETLLDSKKIATSDLSRPGLELTGYFNYYPHERIQMFGRTELTFMSQMSSEERLAIMRQMAQSDTPAFIVARSSEDDMTIPSELLQAAKENGVPVLSSKHATTRISSNITNFLEGQLAERRSIHGVLVDIYGLGVMITGDSGVGKSETALELVKRGHRLIADDRVEVYRQDENTIIGEAPEILRHLIEIRGIGIIDVMNLFGAGAVKTETEIELVVNLELWSPEKKFDRLGSGMESLKAFDVDIPKISIPVKTGRNLAIIIEVAAMNFRAKSMGYDATKTFEANLNRLIENNSEQGN